MGTAENKFRLVLLQTSPVFEKGLPRTEDVEEGETLELKCKVNGSPLPTLQWLKDGQPLVASERLKIIEQPDGLVKLCIENAKPGDGGTYSLEAKNPNGTTTARCSVSVIR